MTVAAPNDSEIPAPILVVDDREDSLRAVRAVLEPLGQTVVSARSGDEALRHLLRHQVAVILLDVNMPGLDGFSTAALIKRRERTRDIPIIFITADRDASERGQVQLGYSSGAVDFLVKPYDPWTLVSKVTVFIELHKRAEQLRRRIDELQVSQAALSHAQRIARLAHF
ncbi:MAG TPA: response regulator, partial [Ilumatobacteraceae bacterium]|nr:response regulator [Ilumatobacteraceae bacterium]